MFALAGCQPAEPKRKEPSAFDRFAQPTPSAAPVQNSIGFEPAQMEGRWAVQSDQTAASFTVHMDLCGQERVSCVVDGDTVWLEGVKIRLADIDAPEVGRPKCASEKALGDKATQRLISLMNEGRFDVVPAGANDADRYGRKLRIFVRGGRSLGDQLVAEGLAREWTGRREPWC